MLHDNHRVHMGLLFLITVLGYGFYNAFLPITDPVESNYVISAIDMLRHNSWISPMIYDRVWFDKPPLTYWALMITYKLLGISDFTSRLPNTLVAGLSVAYMYEITYRIKQSRPVALVSAVVLMSTLQFWYISHAVVTDGFLFLASLGMFGCTYRALENHETGAMVKAYVWAAVGVLAKGPVGLLLPGLILLIYVTIRLFLNRKNSGITLSEYLRILFNPLGITVFFAIAAPWYIAMYQLHGDAFINGFLGLHNVSRALVSEHPKYNVWYFYIGIIPLALLPWTPVLISRLRHLPWKEPFNLFGAVWFFVFVLFYSLVATKYLTYTLPAIIPCIIWAGESISALLKAPDQAKSFTRLVKVPFYLFYCVLLGYTFYDDMLSPLPLLIGLVLWQLCTRLWLHKKNRPLRAAVRYLIPLIMLYSAVTVTVVPILWSQSGVQFKSYITDSDAPVYIYGTYYTSILYYADTIPTQVFVRTTDDARWTEGKTLMPTVTKETFESTILSKPDAIIIVPRKYSKDFKESPVFFFSAETGHTPAATVYTVKTHITF